MITLGEATVIADAATTPGTTDRVPSFTDRVAIRKLVRAINAVMKCDDNASLEEVRRAAREA